MSIFAWVLQKKFIMDFYEEIIESNFRKKYLK